MYFVFPMVHFWYYLSANEIIWMSYNSRIKHTKQIHRYWHHPMRMSEKVGELDDNHEKLEA